MASFGSPTAALRIACVGNSITRGDARQEPGEGTHTPHKYKTFNRGNFPAELATLLAGRAAVANFGHGGCSVLEQHPTIVPPRDATWRTRLVCGSSPMASRPRTSAPESRL